MSGRELFHPTPSLQTQACPSPYSALSGTPVPISMSVNGAPVVPACAGATIILPRP